MRKTKVQVEWRGPVLALDLGQKLVGAAVSDEILITIKRLDPLKRTNWKRLLKDVQLIIQRFDVRTLVIGLPLSLDGAYGSAAKTAEHIAQNFARSLTLPVYLQDERLTSFEARASLLSEKRKPAEIAERIDGEAAAVILRDFLNTTEVRVSVSPNLSEKD